MNLPLLIILFLCSFNLLTASQVMFYKASDKETIPLQNHLICFYSQELLKAGLFTDEASALQAAKEEVLQEATDSPLHFFCLTVDECRDTHFGYIAYSVDAETAYIESIYLDEKYRGQGLGKQTLDSLEHELREKGINRIKLYVFAHNQAAFGLYKNMGYVIEKGYFSNEIPIGYHMKKEISKKNRNQRIYTQMNSKIGNFYFSRTIFEPCCPTCVPRGIPSIVKEDLNNEGQNDVLIEDNLNNEPF